MNSLQAAQDYFDAWNNHDPASVIATFADEGTYSDPAVQGLLGEAIGRYVQGLLDMFPDLAFEIVSKNEAGDGLVAAEWLMLGTHKELGSSISLPGADFIRVQDGKILSVQGYFDNGTLQKQLGLEVTAFPAEPQGPVSFGTALHVAGDKNTRPGAFSITWIASNSQADGQYVSEYTQKIVRETTQMPGFLGIMLPSIGNRGFTVTAWESVEQPRQLLREGQHKESMKWFFGQDSTAVGMTSVWELHHARMMLRCPACNRVVDADAAKKQCSCGEPFPEAPSWW